MASLISVDSEKCISCGECCRTCASQLIELKDGTPYTEAEFCMACGECVSVCPTGALDNVLSPLNLTEEIEEKPVKSQLYSYLRSRRSVRCYKDFQPNDSDIDELLTYACTAQTAVNARLVSFIVINDRDRVKKIADLTAEFIKNSDDEIKRMYEKIMSLYEGGYDSITRGAPGLIFTVSDRNYPKARETSVIYITHAEIYAPSLGLATCWAGIVERALEYAPIREMLGVKDNEVVTGALMVGIPDIEFKRIPHRKKADVTFL